MKTRFAFVRRWSSLALVSFLAVFLQACGGNESQPQQAGENPPAATGAMPRTQSPPGASVFFITPANGSTVASPLTVKFGISGMAVVAAGDMTASTGHHHLLINTQLADPTMPVPKDESHRHFGMGQTETTLELPAGQHTLQLVMGDGNHVPHDPPVVSETITITVE